MIDGPVHVLMLLIHVIRHLLLAREPGFVTYVISIDLQTVTLFAHYMRLVVESLSSRGG